MLIAGGARTATATVVGLLVRSGGPGSTTSSGERGACASVTTPLATRLVSEAETVSNWSVPSSTRQRSLNPLPVIVNVTGPVSTAAGATEETSSGSPDARILIRAEAATDGSAVSAAVTVTARPRPLHAGAR